MTPVLDHLQDVNCAELNRLAGLYALPDFVKSASAEQLYPEQLHSGSCADPAGKLYTCHNPASTFLSHLYFAEKRGEFEPRKAAAIERKLDEFSHFWGIKAATESIKARHDELHKDANAALPDSDFAVVWEDAKGKHRHLRMKSAMEVREAASYLQKHCDAIGYTDRVTIAEKILHKAGQFGASFPKDLDTFIERQAGHGVCDKDEVVAMLHQRAGMIQGKQARDQALKLAQMVETTPHIALQLDTLTKLAECVYDLDASIGMAGKYDDKFKRPESVVFSTLYKDAQTSLDSAVMLTTGKIFNRADFHKLALSDLQDLFGSEFAKDVSYGLDVDVTKLAEVAGSMPRDDAQTFENLMHEYGIPPIHKTGSDRYGLRSEALESLAGSYAGV